MTSDPRNLVISIAIALLLSACGDSDLQPSPTAVPIPAPTLEPISSNQDAKIGIWPISGSFVPDCIQDPFGHRLLSSRNDFHAGLDSCDDNPRDIDDIPGNDNIDLVGFPVYATHDGIITRVRKWDSAWNDSPELCPSLCRFGSFVMIQHPLLEQFFNGKIVQTLYLHLANDMMNFKVGDIIKQGDIIGLVGRTGENIQTTHLHLSLQVGFRVGLIDTDNLINPLSILPYMPVRHVINVEIQNNIDVFGDGECPSAEGGAQNARTLKIILQETLPAVDTSTISVMLDNNNQNFLADFHKRIGVGINKVSDRDDFQQGCTAFEVSDVSENNLTRVLTIYFGGNFDDVTSGIVTLTNVRGATSTFNFNL